ncbi:MAG: hypothetical protein GX348_09150 [Veillonellaceae bacterium]|mgnify:CR=1 FL=1|nr:hypothetical protein [Veillonellaceae bacterium]
MNSCGKALFWAVLLTATLFAEKLTGGYMTNNLLMSTMQISILNSNSNGTPLDGRTDTINLGNLSLTIIDVW